MKRKRIYIAGAFLILVLAFFAWQRPSGDYGAQQEAAKAKTARADSGVSDIERERTARRKASGRILPEGDMTSHHYSRLKDFVIPSCKGKKVSLAMAMQLINEAYQDACYFSLEKPIALTYNTPKESTELLTFNLRGRTWKQCVVCVAALAGMEAKFEGEMVTLIPSAEADEVTDIAFRLEPRVAIELKQMLVDAGEWDMTIPDDPKSGIPIMLHRLGIIDQANISFDATVESARFLNAHFKGRTSEYIAMNQCLPTNAYSFEDDTCKITTKLISSKSALDISLISLEPAQSDELLQDLAKQRGVTVTPLNSVNGIMGQVVRMKLNSQIDIERLKDMTISFDTEFVGLKLGSQISIDHSDLGKTHKPSQILTFSGDSQISPIGNDADGHYYLLTTLQQIIDGQPAESMQAPWVYSNLRFSINYPKARIVPGMPNHVYSPYANTIIDLSDVSSGQLMHDPGYPDAEGKIFRVP